MVQPQARVDTALQWDMTAGGDVLAAGGQGSVGASSQGSLRVPPELASNEIVHRLLGDNHQLREALRRSNVALKERCDDMEGWQRRMREEREFLGSRFREARDLVERLGRENKALQAQLSHTGARPPKPGQDGGHAGAGASGEEPQTQPGVEKEAKEVAETADPHAPPQSLPVEGGNEFLQLLKSHKEKLEEGMQELRRRNEELDRQREEAEKERDGLRSTNAQLQAKLAQMQPAEGGNEFLQLIKSHKEKLEEGMQELRRRNEELEREREEAERERDGFRSTNAQLQAKLAQMQGCGVIEEAPQRSAVPSSGSDSSTLARLTEQLQATQCRYRELQEKLDCLQKTTVQRDRTEALLKQREKEFTQLVKDSEALKAQVTSLLGELNERQSCLESSEKERMLLEEKLSARTDELYSIQREMEQLKKQHSVTVDKLRLQTQNLEAALRTERLVLTEEKRKLAQLQHAYTQLFKDYDTKRKNGGEVEDLANRLVEAERALALKQELIDKLKEEVEQQRGTLETVPVLTAQAEIYKADFRAEREAREKLHQRKEELQEQLSQALAELDRLKIVDSRAGMEEMQKRHREDFRTHPRHPPPAAFAGATVPFSPAQAPSFRRHSVSEELPDFRCPKCQYQAPDMDTLQIHVMDCIQ
ncbi:NF-kappa-B essential modulator isoform X3 [Anguilla anguilla]|uniref:NF-kappa-B essential modulator isoform X3 n=1 Tax=Anguilla anguilla TaxID=7936 RepID=UPI0015AEF2A3|nr:NF-kappa-B essential modulator isoform X3 [Anguilla anguilla]